MSYVSVALQAFRPLDRNECLPYKSQHSRDQLNPQSKHTYPQQLQFKLGREWVEGEETQGRTPFKNRRSFSEPLPTSPSILWGLIPRGERVFTRIRSLLHVNGGLHMLTSISQCVWPKGLCCSSLAYEWGIRGWLNRSCSEWKLPLEVKWWR